MKGQIGIFDFLKKEPHKRDLNHILSVGDKIGRIVLGECRIATITEVEGLPVHDINGNITEIEQFKGFCNCETYPIDENTLCRHATGNIWENDIVKYEGKKGIIRFGKYEWYGTHYGFYVEWIDDVLLQPCILYWADKVKVVGSVVDGLDSPRGGGDGEDEREEV